MLLRNQLIELRKYGTTRAVRQRQYALTTRALSAYPCAVAGALDRIFGLNQAIENLADVSEAAVVEKYQVFCRLCGYYRPIRENSRTLLSATWKMAFERYRAHIDGRA